MKTYLEQWERRPWGSYGSFPGNYGSYFSETLPLDASPQYIELTVSKWKQENPEMPRFAADIFSEQTAIRYLAQYSGLDGGIAIGNDLPLKMREFNLKSDNDQAIWDQEHSIQYHNTRIQSVHDIQIPLEVYMQSVGHLYSLFIFRPDGGIMDLPSDTEFWMTFIDMLLSLSTDDALILMQTSVLLSKSELLRNKLAILRTQYPKWHIGVTPDLRKLCIDKSPHL